MNRIQTLLSLAKEELSAAEILLKNNLYRACISRAYYSLYHTVQALLAAKNIVGKLPWLGVVHWDNGERRWRLELLLAILARTQTCNL